MIFGIVIGMIAPGITNEKPTVCIRQQRVIFSAVESMNEKPTFILRYKRNIFMPICNNSFGNLIRYVPL